MTQAEEMIQQDQVTPGEEPGEPRGEEVSEKLVPVSESIRYRRRAQQAEQQLGELAKKYEQAVEKLNESQQLLDHIEKRQRVDQLLIESDAIDLEAARLLTEVAVEQMEEADIAAVVAELKQRKPYLFRRGESVSGSMSARPRHDVTQMEEVAQTAASSGDRRDLLRYLRMRRKKN